MDASLNLKLTQLGLASFVSVLSELGVSEESDILALDDADLQGIGLTLVQTRKLQRSLGQGGEAESALGKRKAGDLAGVSALLWQARSGASIRPTVAASTTTSFATKSVAVAGWGAKASGGWAAASGGWGAGGASSSTATNGNGSSSWSGKQWTPTNTWAGSGTFERCFYQKRAAMSIIEKRKAEELRTQSGCVIDGGPKNIDTQYPPVSTFEELGVIPLYAITALNEMGITAPMAIQSQALPLILGGHDVVGVAKTGSGKTLAYLLPAVVHIEAQAKWPLQKWDLSPIVLAMAPTRELAVQITDQATLLLKFSSQGSAHPNGLWAACIFGGLKKADQLKQAAGAHIIAATPGRLHDNVENGPISMERVTYFILDEGDRMLDDGFESEVKGIAAHIRPDRQMLFFSATWPKKVQDLAKAMCHGSTPPVRLRIGQSADGEARTRDDIIQEVVVFDQGTWEERDSSKQALLYEHVREALGYEGTKVLVFVSRKDLADQLAQQLNHEGYPAESMHGGRGQDTRLNLLEKFKNWELRLLVTTDVMGRGLDIPTITHVVVFDMGDIEDYVHRIGRTARGPHGEGHALTLFEYNNKWPHLAEGLVGVLQASNQLVPEELANIAWEVSMGQRQVKAMKSGSKWGGLSGWQGSATEASQKKLGYGASAGNGAWQPW